MTTLDIIYLVITGVSLLFSAFLYFREPQEKMELKQAVSEKNLDTKATILAQKELETKALVLAEQVKNKNEDNERRFFEMGKRLDDALALAQNHTHEVSVQVSNLTTIINTLNLEFRGNFTKIFTIIEERLPKQ